MRLALEIFQWLVILALLSSRARIKLELDEVKRRLENIEGSIKDGILDLLRR